MSPFIDPIDAANALAEAAAEVVRCWTVGDLAAAVRGLSDAVDHYGRARFDCPLLAVARPSQSVPLRFSTALAMVDPRAENVAGFAHWILSACAEVASEHGLPAKDPAIRLMVAQLSWTCGIAHAPDLIAELIGECFGRVKQGRLVSESAAR